MKPFHRWFVRPALAGFFIACASAAFAQNSGAVTNHAFPIGKGPGQTGFTSLLCGSAQLAVGQAAANPICVALSGDVTMTAGGVTAIGAGKVTNAMQAATMPAYTIKSNITAGVAGPVDNTINAVLDTYTTTQGSLLYRASGAQWAALTPGTSGMSLLTGGAGANPAWGYPSANTLTGSSLPAGVTGSSLTSVGTLTTGTWNATAVAVLYGGTGATTAANARTNLGVAIGTNVQAWDADLDCLAALATNGLVARTGTGTCAVRTVTAPAAGITVTNGDGVAGNPTLVLANDLGALEGLSGTGIARRTGTDAWSVGTLVTNAELATAGAATLKGNPTASTASVQDFTIQGLSARGAPDATNDKLPIYDAAAGTIKYVTPGQVAASATAGVSTFNGRTGAVLPAQGDYSTSLIPGTATNNNASAGNIGEYVFSRVVSGSAVPLTTATAANVTSISLTAGDWDVSGSVWTTPTGAVNQTQIFGWSSATSATLPTLPDGGIIGLQFPATAGAGLSVPVMSERYSLATTTTIYLSVYVNFSGGTSNAAYGTIRARRVR